MEETTTVAAPNDGAGAPAQPTDGASTTAAQPQETTPTQPAQADDTAAWLVTKGIDPSDPEAMQKLAKMAQNSEKLMSKATNEASELRKSLTQPSQQQQQGQVDNGMQEFMADYRRDKLISGFKESHTDWKEKEPAMAKILTEVTPSGYTNAQLVNAGVLTLESIYAMAKASAPDNTNAIRTDAKNEVLQTLANTQRAGGGTSQASNPNPQAPNEDPINAAIRAARGK